MNSRYTLTDARTQGGHITNASYLARETRTDVVSGYARRTIEP